MFLGSQAAGGLWHQHFLHVMSASNIKSVFMAMGLALHHLVSSFAQRASVIFANLSGSLKFRKPFLVGSRLKCRFSVDVSAYPATALYLRDASGFKLSQNAQVCPSTSKRNIEAEKNVHLLYCNLSTQVPNYAAQLAGALVGAHLCVVDELTTSY